MGIDPVEEEYWATARRFEDVVSALHTVQWPDYADNRKEDMEIKIDNLRTSLHSWYTSFKGELKIREEMWAEAVLRRVREALASSLETLSTLETLGDVALLNTSIETLEKNIQQLPSELVRTLPTPQILPPEAGKVDTHDLERMLTRTVLHTHCDVVVCCGDIDFSYRDGSFGTSAIQETDIRALLKTALRRAHSHQSANDFLGDKFVYLWYGSARVQLTEDTYPSQVVDGSAELQEPIWFLADSYEKQMQTLNNKERKFSMRDHAIRQSTSGANRFTKVSYLLNFVLSAASIYPVPSVDMALQLGSALRKTVRPNWEGHPFISYIHMTAILQEDVLVHCFLRNNMFTVRENAKEDARSFAQQVLSLAPWMLVTCLVNGLEISALAAMMKKNINDHNISTDVVRDAFRDDTDSSVESYLQLLPIYRARILPATRDIFHLRDQDVMPVITPTSRGRKSRANGRSELDVVLVEPGYQKFSSNPRSTFLLKKIRIAGGVGATPLYDGLSRLSHSHLTTHLCGWSSKDDLYLLFPDPDLRLRDILRRSTASVPKLTPEYVSRTLRQLAGIASAINYLSQLQAKRMGFHHDIRPENILLFADEGMVESHTWRLGTFGTVVELDEFLEDKTSSFYAPEYRSWNLRGSLLSGSEDVWSFGCVCVDVLRWMMSPTLKGFHAGEWNLKPGNPFWERVGSAGYRLTLEVQRVLNHAKDASNVPAQLMQLADIASMCLELEHKSRISPPELEKRLVAVLGTELDLGQQSWTSDREFDIVANLEPSSALYSLPSLSSSTSTLESNISSTSLLDANVAAIDGWSIAELGLGVEPHYAEEVDEWHMLARKDELHPEGPKPAAPRSLNTRDDSSGAAPRVAGLENAIAKLDLSHPGRVVRRNSDADLGHPKLLSGRLWEGLSHEEQRECIGHLKHAGSFEFFEPAGRLLEMWERIWRHQLLYTVRDAEGLKNAHGVVTVQLVVARSRRGKQMTPTILVISSSKGFARDVTKRITKSALWQRELRDSFAIQAQNDIVRLF